MVIRFLLILIVSSSFSAHNYLMFLVSALNTGTNLGSAGSDAHPSSCPLWRMPSKQMGVMEMPIIG